MEIVRRWGGVREMCHMAGIRSAMVESSNGSLIRWKQKIFLGLRRSENVGELGVGNDE